MNNQNITKVYLLDVPLESDYKNTLYFANASAQQSYFQNNIVFSFTDFTYQRKDHFIRVPKHFDEVYKCNYVMYQNTAYSNKWFYAFITDIKYVDDGRTDVYIETDVIQTWLFDYDVKASFVEREHVSNDTIGIHTLPEGLEMGEYICNQHTTDSTMDTLMNDICYIMGSTVGTTLENNKFPAVGGDKYNGIYSGVKYYRYDDPSAIEIILELYANHGQSDAISGIFLAPKFLAPLSEGPERTVASSNDATNHIVNKTKNYGLNGYIPKNNKLKTFPFCYMLVSNNQGGNAIYHYEDFSENDCSFVVRGALTPGCSIRLTPTNYKGAGVNDEESVNLGKFPICNYAVDMYTNWLTQNSVNISTNIASNALNTGFSLMTGNLVGAANGVLGITNTLGEVYKHSLVPPQVNGNVNSGDVITSSSKNNFHFYCMSIKQEYAEIIDKYFDMFGYKVNLVKVPNKTHRARWWYTKTIDVNIDGDIPNNDMQKIKDCYNNGITFWRNASEIQNYSLSNGIV